MFIPSTHLFSLRDTLYTISLKKVLLPFYYYFLCTEKGFGKEKIQRYYFVEN
jgi:hypothetical protein